MEQYFVTINKATLSCSIAGEYPFNFKEVRKSWSLIVKHVVPFVIVTLFSNLDAMHVIGVCLPSQLISFQKAQSREKAHKPLRTSRIFL